MEKAITPKAVRDYATSQLKPLSLFLADAGVARTVLYKWENGSAAPGPLTMEKLRRAMGMGAAAGYRTKD